MLKDVQRINLPRIGRKPWTSGYGSWFMFKRSWVQIPVPYTGWTFGHFSHWFVINNCVVCLKRPKINEKGAEVGPFKKICHEYVTKVLILQSSSVYMIDHRGLGIPSRVGKFNRAFINPNRKYEYKEKEACYGSYLRGSNSFGTGRS